MHYQQCKNFGSHFLWYHFVRVVFLNRITWFCYFQCKTNGSGFPPLFLQSSVFSIQTYLTEYVISVNKDSISGIADEEKDKKEKKNQKIPLTLSMISLEEE